MKSMTIGTYYLGTESHPVRGAWIEIEVKPDEKVEKLVAPREGCVD